MGSSQLARAFMDTGMGHSQWKFLCLVMNLKEWQLPVICAVCMFQGDSCWLLGKTAPGHVPEAGLGRRLFKPPVSYSGCLLPREGGCALNRQPALA